jgi:hypothetical protein
LLKEKEKKEIRFNQFSIQFNSIMQRAAPSENEVRAQITDLAERTRDIQQSIERLRTERTARRRAAATAVGNGPAAGETDTERAARVAMEWNLRTIKQLQDGYVRLPVVKKRVQRGSRGGYYYTSPKGTIVPLKREQVEKCEAGTLPGAVSGCPTQAEEP